MASLNTHGVMAKKVLSLGPKGFPREMCQETMNEMDPKNTELTLRAKSSKSLSKNPDSNTETKMMALSGTRGETDRLKVSKTLIKLLIMMLSKILRILSAFLMSVKRAGSSMTTGSYLIILLVRGSLLENLMRVMNI